jgi:hypothetical protein
MIVTIGARFATAALDGIGRDGIKEFRQDQHDEQERFMTGSTRGRRTILDRMNRMDRM